SKLAKAMQDVSIATGLQSRILDRVALDQRRQRRRILIRHPRVAAGLAAALLAAAFFGIYFATRALPLVALEQELVQARDKRGNRSAEVEKWFKEKYRVQAIVPPDLNHAYLLTYDLNGDGKPQLIFHRGNEIAIVTITTSRQNDLRGSLGQLTADSGGMKVE